MKLQYYVLDGTLTDLRYEVAWEMPETDEFGRQKLHKHGGKRRIDYVMQRRSDTHVVSPIVLFLCKESDMYGTKSRNMCCSCFQRPFAIHAVAQLAGLTDHIPYCLSLAVPNIEMLQPSPIQL